MLKLRQRTRKRQIAALKNIDRHGDSSATQMLNTLPVVGGCHNRISTVYSMEHAAEAHRRVDTEQRLGAVVIAIGNSL